MAADSGRPSLVASATRAVGGGAAGVVVVEGVGEEGAGVVAGAGAGAVEVGVGVTPIEVAGGTTGLKAQAQASLPLGVRLVGPSLAAPWPVMPQQRSRLVGGMRHRMARDGATAAVGVVVVVGVVVEGVIAVAVTVAVVATGRLGMTTAKLEPVVVVGVVAAEVKEAISSVGLAAPPLPPWPFPERPRHPVVSSRLQPVRSRQHSVNKVV